MAQSIDRAEEQVSERKRATTVGFQGERGAFGDEAVKVYFGAESEPCPYRSFAEVFRAVAAGETNYGLVPVENSQAGSINDVYDLLRQHDLFVIGEISHQGNDNYTRFIALGREPAPRREGGAKTMLVMATAHQPGSLHKCLGMLAANNINPNPNPKP